MEGDVQQQLSQMQAGIGAGMAAAYAQMDPMMLKIMVDQDIENWKSSDGADEKKWLAKARGVQEAVRAVEERQHGRAFHPSPSRPSSITAPSAVYCWKLRG